MVSGLSFYYYAIFLVGDDTKILTKLIFQDQTQLLDFKIKRFLANRHSIHRKTFMTERMFMILHSLPFLNNFYY